MPTLPAFTTRTLPTVRSNCACVCPHTTRGTSSRPKTGRRRSSGVRRVKISVSFRGVAWQNSTSPNPGATHLLEHGLQPGGVRMDVVKDGDPHDRACSLVNVYGRRPNDQVPLPGGIAEP